VPGSLLFHQIRLLEKKILARRASFLFTQESGLDIVIFREGDGNKGAQEEKAKTKL
jgi:hypothetical protein